MTHAERVHGHRAERHTISTKEKSTLSKSKELSDCQNSVIDVTTFIFIFDEEHLTASQRTKYTNIYTEISDYG